jgi:hypothetical protein
MTEGESKMKFRYVTALLLLVMPPYTALAQASQAKTKYEDETPPPIVQVVTGSKAERKLLSTLLSVKPQIPLGPDYILQGYENEMTVVSQKMSVELQSIERALHSGQITHDEAEYLIQQRYQVAMMQYEVFTALHDALQQEIQQAADSKSFAAKGSDGAVAARLTASPPHPQGQ